VIRTRSNEFIIIESSCTRYNHTLQRTTYDTPSTEQIKTPQVSSWYNLHNEILFRSFYCRNLEASMKLMETRKIALTDVNPGLYSPAMYVRDIN
jgi:hypothetical protein